ncbi:hypothetical protein D3C87_1830480 [compost metagenome]
MPELPADNTDVSTTAFITDAAPSSPARSKISAKGLTLMSSTSLRSRCGSVYGISRPITRIAMT